MATINSLPPEILLIIFRDYLQTETQNALINCVGKVCPNWAALCKDPSLWEEFDGTLPFELLKDYCNERILKNCKTLVFSEIRNKNFLTAEEIKNVYESLPLINCINFSNVMDINSQHFFGELVSSCPELQEIVFSVKLHRCRINPRTFSFSGNKITVFKNFLSVRGKNLVSLDFSNLNLSGRVDFFSAVGNSCPNLEVLKAENVYQDNLVSFPTALIQSQCPKLRILCLGYPVNITNQAGIVGFKNLEIFRNPSKLNFLFPRCSVNAVIFESPNLKELDISKCVFTKSNCLHPANYSRLEKLNISSGIVYDKACFTEVIQNWSCSLKVLDASDMTDDSINDVFQSIISAGGLSNLTSLNLRGTPVNILTLIAIAERCKQLHVLNLEHCYNIGEAGIKYEGKTNVDNFFSIVLTPLTSPSITQAREELSAIVNSLPDIENLYV